MRQRQCRHARMARPRIAGAPLAIFDLAWPEGLGQGLRRPVALLLDEGPEIEAAANRAGFRFFKGIEEFRAYVRREILALDPSP